MKISPNSLRFKLGYIYECDHIPCEINFVEIVKSIFKDVGWIIELNLKKIRLNVIN